jgi:hypothetical protein
VAAVAVFTPHALLRVAHPVVAHFGSARAWEKVVQQSAVAQAYTVDDPGEVLLGAWRLPPATWYSQQELEKEEGARHSVPVLYRYVFLPVHTGTGNGVMISTLRSKASPRPLRMPASASRVSSSSGALAAPPAATRKGLHASPARARARLQSRFISPTAFEQRMASTAPFSLPAISHSDLSTVCRGPPALSLALSPPHSRF